MYDNAYWEKNYYKGYKEFTSQIQTLQDEYNESKLELSCKIIKCAKQKDKIKQLYKRLYGK